MVTASTFYQDFVEPSGLSKSRHKPWPEAMVFIWYCFLFSLLLLVSIFNLWSVWSTVKLYFTKGLSVWCQCLTLSLSDDGVTSCLTWGTKMTDVEICIRMTWQAQVYGWNRLTKNHRSQHWLDILGRSWTISSDSEFDLTSLVYNLGWKIKIKSLEYMAFSNNSDIPWLKLTLWSYSMMSFTLFLTKLMNHKIVFNVPVMGHHLPF